MVTSKGSRAPSVRSHGTCTVSWLSMHSALPFMVRSLVEVRPYAEEEEDRQTMNHIVNMFPLMADSWGSTRLMMMQPTGWTIWWRQHSQNEWTEVKLSCFVDHGVYLYVYVVCQIANALWRCPVVTLNNASDYRANGQLTLSVTRHPVVR